MLIYKTEIQLRICCQIPNEEKLRKYKATQYGQRSDNSCFLVNVNFFYCSQMFEKAAYNNVQHMNQNFVKPSLRVIEEFSVCTSKRLFYAVSSLFSTKFAYTPTLSRKFNPLEVIYSFFKAFFFDH